MIKIVTLIVLYFTLANADLDMDIIKAMEYQKSGKYQKSAQIYDRLHKSTKDNQYNVRAIKSYILASDFKSAKQRALTYLKSNNQNINILLLISEISLLQKDYKEALKYANKALNISRNKRTLNMMVKIYLANKQYKTAYKYSYEAYIKYLDEKSLNQVLSISLKFDKKNGIKILEKHIDKYGFSEALGYKALFVYKENRDINGTIHTYKRLYNHTKKKVYAKAVAELYIAIKQNKKAVKFLEKNSVDDKLLFDLYKYLAENKKAYKLAKKIFERTGDYNYLAEYAMLKYESSQHKSKQLLKDVFENLKIVNSKIDNPTYQNYFGYLLIDHDIDVKSGILWVKKALKSNPKSPYYLDSLAWGYYKQKDYKEAYKAIKIVIDDLGFKDDEVIKHLKQIEDKLKK